MEIGNRGGAHRRPEEALFGIDERRRTIRGVLRRSLVRRNSREDARFCHP